MDPQVAVREYLSAQARVDIPRLVGLLHEEFTLEVPYPPRNFPSLTSGRAAFIELFMSSVGSGDAGLFSDLQFHNLITYLCSDGASVFAEYDSEGTRAGTGLPYRNNYLARFDFKDGLIVRFVERFHPRVVLAGDASQSAGRHDSSDNARMARLADKVILLTGGTKGLGRHMAESFAAEGAHVAFLGRNEDQGHEVAEKITSAGGSCLFLRADVTSEADMVAATAATLNRWGRLDGLVANASNYQDNSADEGVVSEMTLEGWNRIISSDLTGTFLTLKHGLRAMCAGDGGSVVTLASQHAIRGVNGAAGYSAAKGGVISLTHNVASYYARYDIRCNCIAPGVTDTGSAFLDQLLNDPVQGPPIWDVHLGRIGTSADVSFAAVYLLSDESAQVNGAVLPVDGGAVSAAHFRRPVAPDLPQYRRKRDRAPQI